MKRRSIALYSLTAFSSFETLLLIVSLLGSATAGPGSGGQPPAGAAEVLFASAPPLSAVGWIAVGLVVFQGRFSRRSRVKGMFARMGFGTDVYDLMIGMRGGGSRLSLLQNMDSPRHRLELSERTGIDWKEVDRQLAVLERYGLVKIYAQSGTVKLYQVTEQGKLLLKLMEELNG